MSFDKAIAYRNDETESFFSNGLRLLYAKF